MTDSLKRFFEFFGKAIEGIMGKIYLVSSLDNQTVISISPLETEANLPVATSLTPKVAPQPFITLSQVLREMRDFEGKPGDPNWKNNNPLNYRFYDPKGTGTDNAYLPKYRPVKRSPSGFAIFISYSMGWLYAFEDKKQRIKKHPNWTLYDMVYNHAPPEDDNDPKHYSEVIAKRLGVDNTFPVKNIVLS